ncbi:MAG: ABC transporter ATP-binding protein [Anaerolineales bacterium]|nr:ABC transporter ATP-binding protein [Anaerolineales bacterium]
MKGESGSPCLLKIDNLTTVFPTRRGLVKAVDGMSFELRRGEKLGIVGESGSGKSVTLLSILRLVPHPGKIIRGEVFFQDQNMLALSPGQVRKIRGNNIAMIFQDPMSTLNPAFLVGEQIQESLRIHNIVPRSNGISRLFDRKRKDAEFRRVWESMEDVGIPTPSQNARCYPHQFSGGMQQRVLTAIALSCEPLVLLADEPTTALDVTIQAQILVLLDKINRKHGTAIVLVTHNLGVVAEFCETIVVMYAGQLVEKGTTDQIIEDPKHPYTQGLLRCLPKISSKRTKIHPIPGLVPDLAGLPPGCPFSPRCDQMIPECTQVDDVPLIEFQDGRLVRCMLFNSEER